MIKRMGHSAAAAVPEHPCVRCGACCAAFRVQFYWREANPNESEHVVPSGLFEELTPLHRCMKGTSRKHNPQCAALKGRIGERVGCSIYAERPTPCRAFRASFENGERNFRCDEARAKHGLVPLTNADWRMYRGETRELKVTDQKRLFAGVAALEQGEFVEFVEDVTAMDR